MKKTRTTDEAPEEVTPVEEAPAEAPAEAPEAPKAPKINATGEFYAYTADSKTYAIVAPDGRLISPFSYDQIAAEETARRFNRKNK